VLKNFILYSENSKILINILKIILYSENSKILKILINLPQLFACWLLGIGLGYAGLFGLGALIFADWQGAIIYV
jgi:hypothetical protein